MQASDNRENKDKSHEAHPSLGNALEPRHALRRIELLGHWASERKGKIRIVEFHQQPNGDSVSETRWFETWHDALVHYRLHTHYETTCPCCGKHEPAAKIMNNAGLWVCADCEAEMTETRNDLFFYSQGGWKKHL